ncbi:hypothetical protein GCM10028806_43710 [Spirosoma terrae]
MTSFVFSALSPAVTGTITSNAISATVTSGTDLTKLVPTIAISAKATVSPASGVAQDFTNPVPYSVTAEDGTKQTYTVTVTKLAAPKSSAKNILTVSFDKTSPVVKATVDTTAKTVTALLPAGTDVTKLVPTITLSDKATVSPASGVAQDFTKDVTYAVTAEDGSTKAFTMKAATDSYYFANIRMTVNEDKGIRSLNDSCLLNLRTGQVYMLKDGAANAANVDFILNQYCDIELYSPAAVIYCGVSCGVGRVNEIIVGQKWASYRKGFVDNVSANQVKVGDSGYGQIAASEWNNLNFAADITKQFSVGRALALEKLDDTDVYLKGHTKLAGSDKFDCVPAIPYDQMLYRFLTQEGKKGLMRINKHGKTANGGYYAIIDIKIEK